MPFNIILNQAKCFKFENQTHMAPRSPNPQSVPDWVRHSLEFTSGVACGKILDLSRPQGSGADVIPPKQDAFPPPPPKGKEEEAPVLDPTKTDKAK